MRKVYKLYYVAKNDPAASELVKNKETRKFKATILIGSWFSGRRLIRIKTQNPEIVYRYNSKTNAGDKLDSFSEGDQKKLALIVNAILKGNGKLFAYSRLGGKLLLGKQLKVLDAIPTDFFKFDETKKLYEEQEIFDRNSAAYRSDTLYGRLVNNTIGKMAKYNDRVLFSQHRAAPPVVTTQTLSYETTSSSDPVDASEVRAVPDVPEHLKRSNYMKNKEKPEEERLTSR